MAESGLKMDAINCDVDNSGNSNNHCTKEKKLSELKDPTDNHVGEENRNCKTGKSSLSSKKHDLKIDLEKNNTTDLELSLSSMKKDDSGVDFEKSPASMSAQESTILSDGSESISESLTDSAACSCTNSVSDTKLEEKSKANISDDDDDDDQDDFPSLDVQDSKLDSKEGSSNRQRTAEKMDLDAQGVDDSNSDTQAESSEKRKPRRTLALIDSSNSDSDIEDNKDDDDDDDDDVDEDLYADDDDDDDDDNDVDSKRLSSDSEEETEMDYDSSKMPKHTWKAISDLSSREYGHSTKTPASIFREKVTSSLQMVQRFCLQYKMEYHDGCVNALNFNRIGTLLASGSDDLNIVLWNWVRSRPALVFDSGHRSNIFQAKFMPFSGDCHVVSCARDGQVRLAELSLTGVCKGTKKLAQHKGAAHKLALELDSPHVFLSCGEDAMTFEVDLRQEKPNKLVATKENDKKVPLYSIHSNPVNSFEFCVGGRDHYLRIYDKRKIADNINGGVLKKFCPHHLIDSSIKANVTCACYNYNGTEVLGTYNDEDIYLFNNLHSDEADYIHRYQGHRNNATVKGVNFYGPKSEFIVSGSDCGHIFLWDKKTESIVQFMKGDDGGVINVLEPHPFAPYLATSGLDSDVKIWAPTSEEPTKLKGLKKTTRMNTKQREIERVQEPNMIDGQMLWFLMHLQRRRARQDGDDGLSSSYDSDLVSDDDEDEEESERIQCSPS